jgi:hypothetical protein
MSIYAFYAICAAGASCDSVKEVESAPVKNSDNGAANVAERDAGVSQPDLHAEELVDGGTGQVLSVGSDVTSVRLLEPASGRTVGLDSFHDSWAVLEWHSAHCVLGAPIRRRARLARQSLLNLKVRWAYISIDEDFPTPSIPAGNPEAAPAPLALSDRRGQAQELFDIPTVPWFHVIDPQGRIRYSGGLDNTARRRHDETLPEVNFVADAVRQGSEDRAIAVSSAAAEGCLRIKRSGLAGEDAGRTGTP